jgi:hypothetical protein
VYNNKFNEITNKKDYRLVIEELWNFCYEQLRIKIWLKRVEEVIKIEKSKGIDSMVKRKRVDRVEDNLKNNKKSNKKRKENNKNKEKISKI